MIIKNHHGNYPLVTCDMCDQRDQQDYMNLTAIGWVCDKCEYERGVTRATNGGKLTGKENYAFKNGFEDTVITFTDGTTAEMDRGLIIGDFDQVNTLLQKDERPSYRDTPNRFDPQFEDVAGIIGCVVMFVVIVGFAFLLGVK